MRAVTVGWRRYWHTFSCSWGVVLGFAAASLVAQVLARLTVDLIEAVWTWSGT